MKIKKKPKKKSIKIVARPIKLPIVPIPHQYGEDILEKFLDGAGRSFRYEQADIIGGLVNLLANYELIPKMEGT